MGSRGAARDDRTLVAEYGERFEEAVRLRLMADVPLGMFLSGDKTFMSFAIGTMMVVAVAMIGSIMVGARARKYAAQATVRIGFSVWEDSPDTCADRRQIRG